MNRIRRHLANAALLATGIAACDSPATVQPVASISIAPAEPALVRGDTLRLTAVPHDAAGQALSGRPVTWSSSAPGVVSVSATGLLTGLGRGAANITATSEGRSATVSIAVQQRKPVVAAVTISPAQVNVGPADATVELSATGHADEGLRVIHLQLESTRAGAFNHQFHSCSTPAAPATGTSQAGTWKCAIQLPRSSIEGPWAVKSISAWDSAGNWTHYSGAPLAAAGLAATVQVVSPNEDVTPPVVSALSVQPASVNVAAGAQVVEFTFTVTDAGAGLWRGAPGISSASAGVGMGCGGAPLEGEGVKTGTFKCSVTVPANAAAGTWTIRLEVLDRTRNLRQYTSEQLQAAGLPYEITVTR